TAIAISLLAAIGGKSGHEPGDVVAQLRQLRLDLCRSDALLRVPNLVLHLICGFGDSHGPLLTGFLRWNYRRTTRDRRQGSLPGKYPSEKRTGEIAGAGDLSLSA